MEKMNATGMNGAIFMPTGAMDVRQLDRIEALCRELRECRNELCYRCGAYREAFRGVCDHCRYRDGGEWEKAL